MRPNQAACCKDLNNSSSQPDEDLCRMWDRAGDGGAVKLKARVIYGSRWWVCRDLQWVAQSDERGPSPIRFRIQFHRIPVYK
jgi:hypothetical protein